MISTDRDTAREPESSRPSWLVGIDIGGTFTDLVALDVVGNRQVTAKALTTPLEPTQGILDAINIARAESDLALGDVADVVHATTLAINTLIERTGAKVGLITTDGFTDVVELARGNRYDLFDLQITIQRPLVARHARVGVVERTKFTGEVLIALEPASETAALELLRTLGVDSVAVCLLHSYRNPSHERRLEEALRRGLNVHVSISSDVAPIIREYERSLATVINAYIAPKLAAYLSRLNDVLRSHGYARASRIMRSDGGWFSAEEASRYPVRILESGPTAGAIAAATTARQCNEPLAVAFDMGGTTAKACLVVDGEPSMTDELEVSRLERFKKGSGFPVRLPSIDLIEIGAGGGSIASIGPLGLLKVGPESSGAVPGPACYGCGGNQPTVTDADLLLGYLNPTYFAGGSIVLDVEAASRAISQTLVNGTGPVDVTNAAWAIHDLVNENMARAIRLHCLEHGRDPSGVAIVATGGAGPVHASGLMSKVGARTVLCPTNVGVASALGLLQAPRTDERTVTNMIALDELTAEEIKLRLAELHDALKAGRDWSTATETHYYLNMRLRGQGYDVRVLVPDVVSIRDVHAAFRAEYTRLFGRPPSDAGQVEIVDWMVRLIEPRGLDADLAGITASQTQDGKHVSPDVRPVYWGPAHGWQDTAVYRRVGIAPRDVVRGPAIIEEDTSTVLIRPEHAASIDDRLTIMVERA